MIDTAILINTLRLRNTTVY